MTSNDPSAMTPEPPETEKPETVAPKSDDPGGPASDGTQDLVPIEHRPDGIAILRLGKPDEAMVTITRERLTALDLAIESLASHPGLTGVVVTGPSPEMFAAGADIQLIAGITDPEEGRKAAVAGRSVFHRLQRDLAVPVVAAIGGPCLGGGLELALFCDVRVAADHKGTKIGLPEVKLGIIPGFGGSQNLPRLIGIPAALGLILKGSMLPAKAARSKGVVDRVVAPERLVSAAIEEVLKLSSNGRKAPRRALKGSARWMSALAPLRGMIRRKVGKTLTTGPAAFYPAPRRALELVLGAFTGGEEQRFAAEAQALGELIVTPESKALVRLFFLTEGSKRGGKQDGATAVGKAMVVGGGVMGAGIAGLMAQKGVRTRLCDLDPKALARAKGRLQKDLTKQVKRRRRTKAEATAAQDHLAAATEWGSLKTTGLWLEAVVEDLSIKQSLMAQAVARGLPDDALIASNTSSLSLDAMAEGIPHPERVVGLHFFNPPEKMPLVEVIRGPRTDPAAVATACRLATRLGKFPVVVSDKAGFLVNRCLAPYLNEAARLMVEGLEPERLDRVMRHFGMPMGPAELLDEIGFDVATKVSEVMHRPIEDGGFGERMTPCPLFPAMVEAGALGTKSGGGMYRPGKKKGQGLAKTARPGPGRRVLEQLRKDHGGGTGDISEQEILRRLIHPMVDEGCRCVDEGVVTTDDDLDLGLVFGIGFPPFMGGITRYAAAQGWGAIAQSLDELTRTHSPHFAPSDALRRRATPVPPSEA